MDLRIPVRRIVHASAETVNDQMAMRLLEEIITVLFSEMPMYQSLAVYLAFRSVPVRKWQTVEIGNQGTGVKGA